MEVGRLRKRKLHYVRRWENHVKVWKKVAMLSIIGLLCKLLFTNKGSMVFSFFCNSYWNYSDLTWGVNSETKVGYSLNHNPVSNWHSYTTATRVLPFSLSCVPLNAMSGNIPPRFFIFQHDNDVPPPLVVSIFRFPYTHQSQGQQRQYHTHAIAIAITNAHIHTLTASYPINEVVFRLFVALNARWSPFQVWRPPLSQRRGSYPNTKGPSGPGWI